jgi:choline-sulfatase
MSLPRPVLTVALLCLALFACGERDKLSAEAATENEKAGAASGEGKAAAAPTAKEAAAAPKAPPAAAAAGSAAGSTASAEPAQPRRVAIDLLDNRYLAHLDRDGVVVPLNDPGVVKFIQGGWKTGFSSARVSGRRVLKMTSRQGVFYVPARAELCADGCTFYLGVEQPHSGQRVGVFVNKKPLTTQEVPVGYSVVRVSIPKGGLVDGENRVRLFFRRSGRNTKAGVCAYLRWMAITRSKDPALEDLAEVWRTGDGRVRRMNLRDLAGWTWYLPVPAEAELKVRWDDGGALPVKVVALDASGASREALKVASDSASARFKLPSPSPHGGVVGLSIRRTRPVELTEAKLSVPAAEMVPIGEELPKHVLVWMVDTLRRDHLKIYNPKTRVKTPNLDALAARGVVFDDAIVPGAHSIPSHASILSGLFPEVHRHETEKSRLGRKLPLLSTIFKKAGWRTLLLASNGYVSKRWGFHRDFHDYKNFIRDNEPNQADKFWRWLEPWIVKNKDERFFAYLNPSDPHVTYRYRDGYTTLYDPKPYNGRVPKNATGFFLEKVLTKKVKLNARDKERLEAQYDGEITFNDEYLGKMVKKLEELGILEDTLIVIMSDHGDEFDEHGRFGHGHSLYSELIRVPLIFIHPRTLPEGLRVYQTVNAFDAASTLLSITGLQIPESFQSADLLHVIRNHKVLPPRPAFAKMGKVQMAVHLGRHKMLLRHGADYDLFDLRKDPTEQTDLKGSLPVVERGLKDALAFHLAYVKRWKKARHGVATNQSEVFASDAEGWWGSLP